MAGIFFFLINFHHGYYIATFCRAQTNLLNAPHEQNWGGSDPDVKMTAMTQCFGEVGTFTGKTDRDTAVSQSGLTAAVSLKKINK